MVQVVQKREGVGPGRGIEHHREHVPHPKPRYVILRRRRQRLRPSDVEVGHRIAGRRHHRTVGQRHRPRTVRAKRNPKAPRHAQVVRVAVVVAVKARSPGYRQVVLVNRLGRRRPDNRDVVFEADDEGRVARVRVAVGIGDGVGDVDELVVGAARRVGPAVVLVGIRRVVVHDGPVLRDRRGRHGRVVRAAEGPRLLQDHDEGDRAVGIRHGATAAVGLADPADQEAALGEEEDLEARFRVDQAARNAGRADVVEADRTRTVQPEVEGEAVLGHAQGIGEVGRQAQGHRDGGLGARVQAAEGRRRVDVVLDAVRVHARRLVVDQRIRGARVRQVVEPDHQRGQVGIAVAVLEDVIEFLEVLCPTLGGRRVGVVADVGAGQVDREAAALIGRDDRQRAADEGVLDALGQPAVVADGGRVHEGVGHAVVGDGADEPDAVGAGVVLARVVGIGRLVLAVEHVAHNHGPVDLSDVLIVQRDRPVVLELDPRAEVDAVRIRVAVTIRHGLSQQDQTRVHDLRGGALIRISRVAVIQRPELRHLDIARGGIDRDREHEIIADRRAAFDHAAVVDQHNRLLREHVHQARRARVQGQRIDRRLLPVRARIRAVREQRRGRDLVKADRTHGRVRVRLVVRVGIARVEAHRLVRDEHRALTDLDVGHRTVVVHRDRDVASGRAAGTRDGGREHAVQRVGAKGRVRVEMDQRAK